MLALQKARNSGFCCLRRSVNPGPNPLDFAVAIGQWLAMNIAVNPPCDHAPLSFQDIILTLHRYWAQQGCVILQPYDMRVGAGTFHPATTLRSLGPEPWNAAYVQPSRRPTDGRYGENPNRLQHYYQYQVIMVRRHGGDAVHLLPANGRI